MPPHLPSSAFTSPAAAPPATPEWLPPGQVSAPSLWLVRHGESTWNVAGLAQGHNDEAELTAYGLRQAADAAAQFGYRPVRAIYASDLRRAQQTAAAFAAVLGLPVHADVRLRERSLGVLEGSAHVVIDPSATGLADGLVVDPDARPQAGESVRDLYRRAAAFCDDLATKFGPAGDSAGGARPGPLPAMSSAAGGGTGPADTEPASSGGDVLIVAHGGTVRVIDAYLHGVPVDQMTWRPVENATIVRISEFAPLYRGGNR
jgi:2,3-bisphosphoglycerate-dependent phosphoglycerate mutase